VVNTHWRANSIASGIAWNVATTELEIGRFERRAVTLDMHARRTDVITSMPGRIADTTIATTDIVVMDTRRTPVAAVTIATTTLTFSGRSVVTGSRNGIEWRDVTELRNVTGSIVATEWRSVGATLDEIVGPWQPIDAS